MIRRVSFITLGCKVNIYESNQLTHLLEDKGFLITEPNELSDVFIINTCSVTNKAAQKSRQMISRAKSLNKDAIICVIGCFSQTASNSIDADIVLGNGNKMLLPDLILEQFNNRKKVVSILDLTKDVPFEDESITTYDHARVFLKIQDGCDQFCSYCIIPYARGGLRSKDYRSIITEINNILSNGYSEIVLSGIHTGKYFYDGFKLSDLIELILEECNDLKILRISSIEIIELDDKFLSLLKNNKVLADHLHLPLQAGSDRILKLMNRPYDKKTYLEFVNKIRAVRPNISLSTDIIVGFPTETEEEFQETLMFAKEIGFSKIHVFPFSKRDGTVAASMQDLDGNVKKDRVRRLMALSSILEQDYNDKFIGKEVLFLVERKLEDGYYCGHTSNYLFLKVKGDLKLRSVYNVKVIKKENLVLYGELVH